MTIEEFQLLAWLRVGEAAVSIVLYAMFLFGIMKVYKKAGVSLVGIRGMFVGFLTVRIFALLLAISYLSQTLTQPEDTIQQYIKQQVKRTSSPLFDILEELSCGEKSSA